MADHVLEVTDASFEAEVLQADVPVMVDLWAPWCGPCRRVAPLVEELAASNAGKVKVCKVNVDDNQTVAATYSIASIPTILFFKDGQELTDKRLIGLRSKSDYQQIIDALA